ncbi:PH domain-containing protein [Ectothiorhodospiraceae bacterium BW-2]|nr:PH domain-containing protein [Ectothiorhodospiraceae bacterium BW-2]
MGLMSALTGNASEIDSATVMKELGPMLAEEEEVTKAYKMVRDYFVFTTYRLLMVDKQGLTGKKTEYRSIPYRTIITFKVETAGHGFDDAELTIQLSTGEEIKREFNKGINVAELQQAIATHIARH